jgi:hypothetical protein
MGQFWSKRRIHMIFNILRSRSDLRQRLLVTLAVLTLYRIASHISLLSAFDTERLREVMEGNPSRNNTLQLLTGSNMARATIVALGVYPLVFAMFWIRFLTLWIPSMERRVKKNGLYDAVVVRWTTLLSLFFAAVWAWMLPSAFAEAANSGSVVILGEQPGVSMGVQGLTLFTGYILVWLFATSITTGGVGNGLSLLVTTNYLVALSYVLATLWNNIFVLKGTDGLACAIMVACAFVILAAYVAFEERFLSGTDPVLPILFAYILVSGLWFPGIRRGDWVSRTLFTLQPGSPLFYFALIAGVTLCWLMSRSRALGIANRRQLAVEGVIGVTVGVFVMLLDFLFSGIRAAGVPEVLSQGLGGSHFSGASAVITISVLASLQRQMRTKMDSSKALT